MEKLLINSIYRATEGEGLHLGMPQVFVRFQGCAIGCLNCDSKDTWVFDERYLMGLECVLDKVRHAGMDGRIKRVSITGGDPLHPKILPQATRLAKELKARRYYINVEAAGSRIDDTLFDLVDFISFDFKTPSTGVVTNTDLIVKLATKFPGKFQIKSVVETRADFEAAMAAYKEVLCQVEGDFPWVLTPAYNLGEEFPRQRFEDVIMWNEKSGGSFRVIGQQHKWIHGPDKKQV